MSATRGSGSPAWWAAPVYNPVLAQLGYLAFCLIYVLSTLLPAIVLAFAVGVYLKLVPAVALQLLACLVALDFVVPVENGFKPNLKRAQALSRFIFEGGAAYFGAKTICKAKLSKEKTYVLAAFPHAMFGGAGHFCFQDLHAQGMHVICAGVALLKYIPFLRRFMLMSGYCGVDKGDLNRVLKGRTYPYNVVHLVVGGINEMFYGNRGVEQIVLAKRKGFIKLAMQSGAEILPCYTFGNNQAYWRPFGPDSLLAALSSKLQISLVPWFGRFYIPFGCVPFKVPVLTVVGEPFAVPQRDVPTREEVDEAHRKFCDTMRALFDTHKADYVKMCGADEAWLAKTLKLENER